MISVLRDHEWGDAIGNLLDIVTAMPEGDYSWKPSSPMRSFGEVVGHITNVQFRFCDIIASDGSKPDREDWEKRPDRAEALRGLRASLDRCDEVMNRLTDADLTRNTGRGGLIGDALVTMTGHTRRETGKLVSYLTARGHRAPQVLYQCGRRWRSGAMAATDIRGSSCVAQ